MGTLAYCEDPDEMLPGAAFHKGLHFSLRKKSIFKERNITFFEMIICVEWAILTLLNETLSEFPMVHKGFMI